MSALTSTLNHEISTDIPIICLMGPTASGKTPLAVALAKHLPCEIISVDSALVYRGMNIGTAKPDADILRDAPHHLIDIRDPSEFYSAGEFYADAQILIRDIISRQKIPLLVGGTMLYFKVLREGIADIPKANPEIRAKLNKRIEEAGLHTLHAELTHIDPTAAARINPNDKQRIARALEVYVISGKTLTEWQSAQVPALSPYRILNLALAPTTRAKLHERIELRFKQMINQGWLDEVRNLFSRDDLHADLPAIRAVGYRKLWAHLANEMSYDEALMQALVSTRQFAKRQMTWLNAWPNLTWFDSDARDLVGEVLRWLEAAVYRD